MSRPRAKSPRRKPKQARAQQTIRVILEGAARVLRARGYAGATTNRIAAEAGVSVGTVYEYFASKDEVFDALIAREIGAVVTAFQAQRVDASAGLEAAIGGLIAAGMSALRHGPEMIRMLEAVPGASFRRQLVGAREIVVRLVRDLLEAHRDTLRVAELDLAAFIVVSAVEGVAANADSSVFDERLARELASLVLGYLTGLRSSAAGQGDGT